MEINEAKIEEMLNDLEAMRKKAWGKDENIYKLLGATMGKLMDIRLILRENVRNGS